MFNFLGDYHGKNWKWGSKMDFKCHGTRDLSMRNSFLTKKETAEHGPRSHQNLLMKWSHQRWSYGEEFSEDKDEQKSYAVKCSKKS